MIMTKNEVKQVKDEHGEKYKINCIDCGENIGEITELGESQWTYECADCGHIQIEDYENDY